MARHIEHVDVAERKYLFESTGTKLLVCETTRYLKLLLSELHKLDGAKLPDH